MRRIELHHFVVNRLSLVFFSCYICGGGEIGRGQSDLKKSVSNMETLKRVEALFSVDDGWTLS